MDDSDCAKCQNPKLRDMMGIFGMFNENKTKANSDLLLQKHKKTGKGLEGDVVGAGFVILERE